MHTLQRDMEPRPARSSDAPGADEESRYQPIEDYGVIGDLHTVALVGRNGSIDFLAYPSFDSPTVFAALLDDHRGGRFRLQPCLPDGARKQLYLPDTNVLLTRTLHASGVTEVSDLMPVAADAALHSATIVRRAKCVRGAVTFDMVCEPRFNYGRADHVCEVVGGVPHSRSTASSPMPGGSHERQRCARPGAHHLAVDGLVERPSEEKVG
jgi:GH15 family glucan-1,4-alpha-glucosidase